MSLPQHSGPARSDQLAPFDSNRRPGQSSDSTPLIFSPEHLMRGAPDGSDSEGSSARSLDAHDQAREIIRLVQCSQCSLPLDHPVTLPCGNSLCRQCLPPRRERQVNILYMPISQQVFDCPFDGCDREHQEGECCQDVTLTKVTNVVREEIARYRPMTSDTPLLLDEILPSKDTEMSEEGVVQKDANSSSSESLIVIDKEGSEPQLGSESEPHSRVLHGGRLVATYTLAEMGELRYGSEVSYKSLIDGDDRHRALDVAVLEHLMEATRSEIECLVCYGVMLDPTTTACGHTFCRQCLHRVNDHAPLCPICRHQMYFSSSLPVNRRLAKLLDGLCPDLVHARRVVQEEEEKALREGFHTPIFVCTLSFPGVPTFLHIFEPRYRLMMRRAIESGNARFGMVSYNTTNSDQGEFGLTDFLQYGTMLEIEHLENTADGRMMIETKGVYRFKINEWNRRDGYVVANVDRLNDVSIEDEVRLETEEMSRAPHPPSSPVSTTTRPPSSAWPTPPSSPSSPELDHLSTQELFEIGKSFIDRMIQQPVPFLHRRVLLAYGDPPTNPALFPYWFASVVPISDQEKYKLLPTTSVRARLKLVAGWTRGLQASRWIGGLRRRASSYSPYYDEGEEGEEEGEENEEE